MSKTVPVMNLIAILIGFEGQVKTTWDKNDDGNLTWAGEKALYQINNEIESLAVYDRVSINYMYDLNNRLEAVGVHCFKEMEQVFHQKYYI